MVEALCFARLIYQPVPVVPLPRFVPKVGDESAHIIDAHAVCGSGLRNDIFLDHDTAEVVCAELQCDLPYFGTLGNPRTLDVFEVVKIDAAERLHP